MPSDGSSETAFYSIRHAAPTMAIAYFTDPDVVSVKENVTVHDG